MQSVERSLTKRLKLKVNKAKSAVAQPSKRKFLGFSFTSRHKPRRRIAPRHSPASKARPATHAPHPRRHPRQIIKQLSRYLIGWRAYFGFCQTPSVFTRA